MRLFVVVVLAASCAKSLDELPHIACATDGRCPKGYSCLGDELGCIKPEADGLCDTRAVSESNGDVCASALGSSYSCVAANAATTHGHCLTGCQAGNGCSAPHVCSSLTAYGWCLVDPAQNQDDCPPGTTKGMTPAGVLCVPDDAPTIDSPCFDSRSCGLQDAALRCQDGTCVPMCMFDPMGTASCSDPTRVPVGAGDACSCFAPCDVSGTCGSGFRCLPEVPTSVCVATRPTGIKCDGKSDCTSDLCVTYMDGFVDSLLKVCSLPCAMQADCPPQWACDMTNHECAPE